MNKCGIRTSIGKKFTEDSIQWIRYKHRIPSFYENSRSGLSVKEASVCLGISTGKIYYYIDKGLNLDGLGRFLLMNPRLLN